ncbi:MAG: hypothetical protein K5770_00360 [Lachnospiraceae bacterium]|nr:hypothetical protein [Lachnospiraceae bacterium]
MGTEKERLRDDLLIRDFQDVPSEPSAEGTVKERIRDRLLKSYAVYYNVSTMGVREPFFAEAEFHQNDKQYFLVKAAKIAESDSHEYVYFADAGVLGVEALLKMCEEAWKRGLFLVRPKSGHKNTDVLLFIIADSVPEETEKKIGRIKKYKSYKYTFWGWSKFRLVAIDTKRGKAFYNREGGILKGIVSDILSEV